MARPRRHRNGCALLRNGTRFSNDAEVNLLVAWRWLFSWHVWCQRLAGQFHSHYFYNGVSALNCFLILVVLTKSNPFVGSSGPRIVREDLQLNPVDGQRVEDFGGDQPGRFRAETLPPDIFFPEEDAEQAASRLLIDVGDSRGADELPIVVAMNRPTMSLVGERQDDAGEVRRCSPARERLEVVAEQARDLRVLIPADEGASIPGQVVSQVHPIPLANEPGLFALMWRGNIRLRSRSTRAGVVIAHVPVRTVSC